MFQFMFDCVFSLFYLKNLISNHKIIYILKNIFNLVLDLIILLIFISSRCYENMGKIRPKYTNYKVDK